VLQAMVPVWQGLPVGVQGAPAMHAAHAPSKQTSFVPHAAPLGRLPVALHVEAPDPQEVTPAWHTLPFGLHDRPALQSMHMPSLQTWFVPQGVPSLTLANATQPGIPEAQDVAPF
jgi:hypothetical protein